MNYLVQQKKTGVLANEWNQIEDLYNKKLWHQLTLKVLEIVHKPELQKGQELINLYENFITDFEHRINPLSLVEICLPIYPKYPSNNDAIAFIEKIKEKVKYELEASVLCDTIIGVIRLQEKNYELTKKLVEETEVQINQLDGVTSVHARFYELASSYYRLIGSHGDYYRNALRFLGCCDYEKIPLQERQERAFYLALAAILGDGIYNFGELLMHPILESLKGTPNAWLVDLLFAFNRGDIDMFDRLKPSWTQQADLKAAEIEMRKKICLLCLMEIAFTRPTTNRQLTFEEVAQYTKLPANEVELLVMKALSLDLVRGSIDEIEHKVYITWVQPRVLDGEQLKMMKKRLEAWSSEVNKMIFQVHESANEILS